MSYINTAFLVASILSWIAPLAFLRLSLAVECPSRHRCCYAIAALLSLLTATGGLAGVAAINAT